MPCDRFRFVRHASRVGLLLVGLAPGIAAAHYPWLTPARYTPEPGQPLAFSVGWGHAFPGVDTLDAQRLEAAQLVAADGAVYDIELVNGTAFTTAPLPGEGPWLLAARQASAYYSRTPRGGQRSSRREHPDALSCGYSSNGVKALLGEGAGALDQPLGHPLELVPVAEAGVSGVRVETPLAVRVLLHGRPWTGTVEAVFAGFEGTEDQYPLSAETDADGVARLEFTQPGRWMIKAAASEPYPDPAVCDRSNYTATLTLMVR